VPVRLTVQLAEFPPPLSVHVVLVSEAPAVLFDRERLTVPAGVVRGGDDVSVTVTVQVVA
jgi:hypothetical protein